MLVTSAAEAMNPKYRETMEDSYRIVRTPEYNYFELVDGHGGRATSQYVCTHLFENIQEERKQDPSASFPTILERAYLITDTELCDELGERNTSGATAVSVIEVWEGQSRMLYTANVGDSRAVLSRKGLPPNRLSVDHKAESKDENDRILHSGGTVFKDRVMGMLAVARSFGDRGLKKYVTCHPSLSTVNLKDDAEFLILACDGIWDVLTDQEAIDLVRNYVKTANDLSTEGAANVLIEKALKRDSTDNITVIVVFL